MTKHATDSLARKSITLTTTQIQEAINQSRSNNPQCPNKLNIKHIKHIGPLGLAFLTSMFKTALNYNIIPHIWKLANIVPIPNPTKTPTRVIQVHIPLEKSILPYITENIPNTSTQHGYKTQHSTVTELHTSNGAPCANNHCSKAFDIINIHTIIRKLLLTNIPCTIIRFIANYIKGRKTYTSYRSHTSIQRQFKTGVPQGGVLSPTLFNIYTSDLPPPITSTHKYSKEIHTSIHTHCFFFLNNTYQSYTKSRQNNSLHSRSCRIYEQSGLQSKQHCTTHGNAPKGSGSYLRPKIHIQHTFTTSQYTHITLYK